MVVTGGAGFIGSHLVDALLALNHHVTVIDDLSTGRESNLDSAKKQAAEKKLRLEIIKGSISDPKVWEKLPRHDGIFHMAAQTSVTVSVKDPDLDFNSNILSAKLLINWLRSKKVRTLVYANTAGALYGQAQHFPTDERHPLKPLSPYGATKAFTESYLGALGRALKDLKEWSDDPAAENYFSWAALRLGNVYGDRQYPKGEAGVLPIFIETICEGKAPTIFGDGAKTRDYVHVRDVVSAFVTAFQKLQTKPLDECFNVATGVETRDIDVFDHIIEALHARAGTPGASARVKNSLSIKEPKFAGIRAGEVVRSLLDVNKIEAYLGWKPTVDFAKGVVETVNNYPL